MVGPTLKEWQEMQWQWWKGETYVPPVPAQWLVEVRSDDGRYNSGKAGFFCWKKGTRDNHIVEYRVIRRVGDGEAAPTRSVAEIQAAHASEPVWRAWNGGASPVPPEAMVEVQLRNGNKKIAEAGQLRWEHKPGAQHGFYHDIVAYRIVNETLLVDRPPTHEVGVTGPCGERINRGLALIEAARSLVNEARQIEGPGGKMTNLWTVSRPALRGLIDALVAVEKEVF